MADVLSEFPTTKPETKYPTREPGIEWADGRTHKLVKGRDFDAEVVSMRSALYDAQESNRLIVRSHEFTDERGKTCLAVQYYPPEVELERREPQPDESDAVKKNLRRPPAERERAWFEAKGLTTGER